MGRIMGTRPQSGVGGDNKVGILASVGEPASQSHAVDHYLGEVAGRGLRGQFDVDDSQLEPAVPGGQALEVAARAHVLAVAAGGQKLDQVWAQVCVSEA